MSSILIRNGYVVDSYLAVQKDVYIEGGRIAAVGRDLDCRADAVIDAKGKFVMPGLVDMHCHLREPGQEHKETIATGSYSALKGGYTSIACMPNTSPAIDNAALVYYVRSKAKEADNAKVYVIGSITKGQKGEELAEIAMMHGEGIVAVSDDGSYVADGGLMKNALEYAKTYNLLVISHSEDKTISGSGVVNDGVNATVSGLRGINRAAEEAAVARDIILAEHTGARLHIAHVSTAGSVELVRHAKQRGVRVTCEACPHHFTATDEEILGYNTNAKINPPLREEADVLAIIEGIKDGTIDVIATDHAPHSKNEKNREFDAAPFGTVGFETALSLAYTFLVDTGDIELPELVRLMSYNPARILGIDGGEIKEGVIADIAVFDPEAEWIVNAGELSSKSKNSLFDGWKLTGKVTNVIVDGVIKKI